MFRRRKYILYAEDGSILMICRDRRVILHYARKLKNERANSRQKSVSTK